MRCFRRDAPAGELRGAVWRAAATIVFFCGASHLAAETHTHKYLKTRVCANSQTPFPNVRRKKI
jgi:hypothetical protein